MAPCSAKPKAFTGSTIGRPGFSGRESKRNQARAPKVGSCKGVTTGETRLFCRLLVGYV